MNRKLIRFVLCLLALCLAIPLVTPAAEPPNTLVVASTTGISGEFMAAMWGNNTVDVDLRILLHDYPTTLVHLDESVVINDVAVKRHEVTTDDEGNAVHTFTLHDYLLYSDGSQMTAKDYVFSVLLESSPAIRDIGGVNTNRVHLVGAEEYISGQSNVFSGVRLLGDFSFSLTVKKEYLPYFYNLNYVSVQPYPSSVIAPGCEVKDEGEGAFMEGDFTAELLEKTILAPETGYLSCPQVTSGPYKLASCDREKRTVLLEANPYYLGTYDKQKPKIQRIMLREIKNHEIADALKNGEVHLVNKISSADVIDAVRGMAGDHISVVDYSRIGFAYLHCSCEREITSSPLFRQALSRMVDREGVISQFLKGYGKAVYAHYGLGQWMINDLTRELSTLNKYPFDLNEAIKLLEADGWTVNHKGDPYIAGTDGLRYKQMGQELKPLTLKMGLTPDNQAAETLLASLKTSLEAVGGSVETEYMVMPELLRQYYRQDERRFDLLFLGSNFDYVYDPYLIYQVSDEFHGIQNPSGIRDEKLLELAKQLRETVPGDKQTFTQRWFDFQDHWAEVLPAIPLYSNTYFDAYTSKLTGYHPDSYFSWAQAILYASLKE